MPRKGPDLLLGCAAYAAQATPAGQILFAGDGDHARWT